MSTIVQISPTEEDSVVGAVNGLVKADGAGNISAATLWTDYARSKAPAADISFAGTISAAATTATFSSAADYALARVGSVVVANGEVRYVIRLLGSNQVTLDQTTTWGAGTAITMMQEPEFVTMDEAGNVHFFVAIDGTRFALSDAGEITEKFSPAGKSYFFRVPSTAGANSLRVWGYQAGIEFLNEANNNNFYIGQNDNDNGKLYIGGGYGPAQGIYPAIVVHPISYLVGLKTTITPTDGAGALLFGNGTKPTGMSNEAGLFAKDVAGTTEMHAFDEAGNETLISAHAGDAPGWMYDAEDGVPMIVKEAQYFLGTVRYSNRTRADRLLEMTDAEKSLLPIEKRRVTFTETFAEHNARLGLAGEKALVKLDWETEQDKVAAVMEGRKQAIMDRLSAIDVRLAEIAEPKAPVETEGLSEEEVAKLASDTAKIEGERKRLMDEKEATKIPEDHVRKPLPKHLDRVMKAREK